MIVELVLAILLTSDALANHISTSTKRIRKRLPAPNRTALIMDYGVSNEEHDLHENMTKNIKNAYDRNKNRGYRGWTHPPKKVKEWDKWLDDYYEDKKTKTNIDYVDPDNIHEFDRERGPNSGFPPEWADLGTGQQGVAPPPWAYEPVFNIKPRCCYLSMDLGEFCKDVERNTTVIHKRYAYNPILNKCEEFQYKGCNGNKNNFEEKMGCEETCIKSATSAGGCDHNSHIRIEKKDLK